MDSKKIKTRFPPSPTGVLHIGSVRTALFNYLFAKQNGGEFVLRIEDTDTERSKKEFEEDIKNGLAWLGMEWDEFYRQSERVSIYRKYIEKLIEEGKAYESKEEKGERDSVIRLKNPGKEVVFEDIIRGEIKFDTTELGDFVIAKDTEKALYHLAVVIDDFEMDITHVIRGEDHISNTPRQILIQEALGFPVPQYAHMPLILGEDKSKLSKRHGATSVNEYREMGYLPEAVINFVAFLGWNPGTEKEIYTIDELLKDFSLEKIQKSGAVFNIKKLNWINTEHLTQKTTEELGEITSDYMPSKDIDMSLWNKIIKLFVDDKRIEKLSDIEKMLEVGELDYFFNQPKIEASKLNWKNEKDINNTKENLETLVKLLDEMGESDFASENIKNKIWDYTEDRGRGNVLWPFRVALTGLDKSPDPFSISEILGKQKTIERLKNAIDQIK